MQRDISWGQVSRQCDQCVTHISPVEKPTRADLAAWDNAVRNVTSPGLILLSQLGKYLRKSHLHSHQFLSEDKRQLFFLDLRNEVEEKHHVYEEEELRYETCHRQKYQWHRTFDWEPQEHFSVSVAYSPGLEKVSLHSNLEVTHNIAPPTAFGEVLYPFENQSL